MGHHPLDMGHHPLTMEPLLQAMGLPQEAPLGMEEPLEVCPQDMELPQGEEALDIQPHVIVMAAEEESQHLPMMHPSMFTNSRPLLQVDTLQQTRMKRN